MTRNFTFFAALFLVTMSIFAQKPVLNSSNEATGSFLKSRFGQHDNSSDRNRTERKNGTINHLSNTKSAEAVKQRLDSYSAKYYDATSSQWIPEEKMEFTYDANWNNTYEKEFTWDEFANEWIEDWRSQNTYNASGNLTQSINSSLNEVSNQFYVTSKYQYTYDARGNLTQEIRYESNGTATLFASDKYVYTYDAGDKLIKEIYYQADDNDLLRQSRQYEYTYDASGREINSIYSYWSGIEWILSEKNESTYNSNGNITLYTSSSWDGINNKYSDPNQKTEYRYNASGKLTQMANFGKSPDSNWEPVFQNDYTYDANGNNTQQIYYRDYNAFIQSFEDAYKDEYTLNTNFTFSDLIAPYWIEDEFNNTQNMVTEVKSSELDRLTLKWIPSYTATLVYSEQTFTSVSPKGKDLINIYPNPFTEAVSINLPASYSKITFDLFDQQGRKVMTNQISSNEKISLEGYSKGIYLYKLNIDGKIQSGKLVKK